MFVQRLVDQFGDPLVGGYPIVISATKYTIGDTRYLGLFEIREPVDEVCGVICRLTYLKP